MKFKFTHDAEVVMSDNYFYDLFESGYIRPEELLDDKNQIDTVREAMDIVHSFLTQSEQAGLIEEI